MYCTPECANIGINMCKYMQNKCLKLHAEMLMLKHQYRVQEAIEFFFQTFTSVAVFLQGNI